MGILCVLIQAQNFSGGLTKLDEYTHSTFRMLSFIPALI